MKKAALAKKGMVEKSYPNEVSNHEHIHAANCGHKSYVHGEHIDFEHDGHFHYYLKGKTFKCEGPFAKPNKAGTNNTNNVVPFKKK
jgi:hypothetical protein